MATWADKIAIAKEARESGKFLHSRSGPKPPICEHCKEPIFTPQARVICSYQTSGGYDMRIKRIAIWHGDCWMLVKGRLG